MAQWSIFSCMDRSGHSCHALFSHMINHFIDDLTLGPFRRILISFSFYVFMKTKRSVKKNSSNISRMDLVLFGQLHNMFVYGTVHALIGESVLLIHNLRYGIYHIINTLYLIYHVFLVRTVSYGTSFSFSLPRDQTWSITYCLDCTPGYQHLSQKNIETLQANI